MVLASAPRGQRHPLGKANSQEIKTPGCGRFVRMHHSRAIAWGPVELPPSGWKVATGDETPVLHPGFATG
jgi:hypothetical protein